MTRVEKNHSLRAEVNKEIKDNIAIWNQQKQLAEYEKHLLKINADYFQPVFKKVNESLNLVNLESNFLKNNYHYLHLKDKYLIIKMLSDLNKIFTTYQAQKSDETQEITIIDVPEEYNNLIANMDIKAKEFETKLNQKLEEINKFVINLEKKYQKFNNPQEFSSSLEQIKNDHIRMQEAYQQLRAKGKLSYKFSFTFFLGIIFSLIAIVVLLLVIVMLK